MGKQSKEFPCLSVRDLWWFSDTSKSNSGIESLLITSFLCPQSETFKNLYDIFIFISGEVRNQQLKLEAKYSSWRSFSLFTHQVFNVFYVFSIMPCSMTHAREVLWKCKVWLGDGYSVIRDQMGVHPHMRIVHGEGRDHCALQCLGYSTRRRWGLRGGEMNGHGFH